MRRMAQAVGDHSEARDWRDTILPRIDRLHAARTETTASASEPGHAENWRARPLVAAARAFWMAPERSGHDQIEIGNE